MSKETKHEYGCVSIVVDVVEAKENRVYNLVENLSLLHKEEVIITAERIYEIDDIIVDSRPNFDGKLIDPKQKAGKGARYVDGYLCEGVPVKRDFTPKGGEKPEGYDKLTIDEKIAKLNEIFEEKVDERILLSTPFGYRLGTDWFSSATEGTYMKADYQKIRSVEENTVADKKLTTMSKILKMETISFEDMLDIEFSPLFNPKYRMKHEEMPKAGYKHPVDVKELAGRVDDDKVFAEVRAELGGTLPIGQSMFVKDAAELEKSTTTPPKKRQQTIFVDGEKFSVVVEKITKQYSHEELWKAVAERVNHPMRKATLMTVGDGSLVNTLLRITGFRTINFFEEKEIQEGWKDESDAKKRDARKSAKKQKGVAGAVSHKKDKSGKTVATFLHNVDFDTQESRIAELEEQIENCEDRTMKQILRDELAIERYNTASEVGMLKSKQSMDIKPDPKGNILTNQIKVGYVKVEATPEVIDNIEMRKELAKIWDMYIKKEEAIMHMFPKEGTELYMGGVRWSVPESFIIENAKYENAITDDEDNETVSPDERIAYAALSGAYTEALRHDGCSEAVNKHIDSKS